MIITEENEKYYLEALRVDFLTERWEREWYAQALMNAVAWGRERDKENMEYTRENNLVDKYRNHEL